MNWKTFATALLVIMTWMPLDAATDPFYQARLKEGLAALQAQRPVDAVDQLRIAAFGMLDSPKELSQALALLAIAQNSLGHSEEVGATMTRFVEVETRFPSYDPALLGEFRAPFESLVLRTIPRPTLAGVPSLARLVPSSGGNTRATTTTITAPTTEAPPEVPATRPPQTQNASSSASAAAQQQRTPPQTSNAPAQTAAPKAVPSTPAPSVEGTDAISKAMQLMKDRRAPEAVDLITLALSKEPARRDLRLTLLQAGAMSSNWPVAIGQLSHLKPFLPSETVPMFYAAVALYETGKLTEARELLDRSLPKIARSAYVDYYAKKIKP